MLPRREREKRERGNESPLSQHRQCRPSPPLPEAPQLQRRQPPTQLFSKIASPRCNCSPTPTHPPATAKVWYQQTYFWTRLTSQKSPVRSDCEVELSYTPFLRRWMPIGKVTIVGEVEIETLFFSFVWSRSFLLWRFLLLCLVQFPRCCHHVLLATSTYQSWEQWGDDSKELPSHAVIKARNETADELKEILTELKNVERQNFISHCLLSALIVLTVTWQLYELSLSLSIWKLKQHWVARFESLVACSQRRAVTKKQGR